MNYILLIVKSKFKYKGMLIIKEIIETDKAIDFDIDGESLEAAKTKNAPTMGNQIIKERIGKL